ncbi:MAG: hypothetical protein JNM56_03800 [Planctomycetia bacterium]|nr:hypothetical protein [Planctomycetia bacterium]
MTAATRCRLGICLSLACAALPIWFAPAQQKSAEAEKTQLYKGKVLPLADLLDKQGVKMDKEAAVQLMVLVGDDGQVHPLVKDDGARMFWKDAQLLNRPMRLTARPVGGTNFLQVFQVHSYRKGQLHEVYYWCDICIIKRFEKRDCECCGAPMEFREPPVQP